LIEFKTGTNPIDGTSRFSVQASVLPETGQTAIRWEAAPGRGYRVEYKDDLGQATWNNLPAGVGIIGSKATCLDNSSTTVNQRFYRVTLVE